MKTVANINGVNVYSDKPGSISINGSRITFADGSSCDVRTKVVNNRGSGSIRIGEDDGNEAGQERVMKGPMHFSTTDLRLSNFTANVVVEVWGQSGMEIVMSGPKDALEAIVAKPDNSMLSIEGKEVRSGSSDGVSISGVNVRSARGSSHMSVIGSIVGRSVVITGDNVVVVSGDISSKEIITVTVKVPRGTYIVVDGVDGDVSIGDVDGSLDVNAKGSAEIRVGRMREATIAVFGATDVCLAEVNGSLTANIMGSGDINVRSGIVTDLRVQIVGSGDFYFGGEADTATLSVMGSGDITVDRVKGRVNKRSMGSGSINVG